MFMQKNIFKNLENKLKILTILMLSQIIIFVMVTKSTYLNQKIFLFHQKLKFQMIILKLQQN